MLFVIDAGNTNVVFAAMAGEAVKASWRIATDRHAREGALKAAMEKGLQGAGLDAEALKGGILASVVPALDSPLKAAFRALSGKPLMAIGDPGVELGIAVRMDKPREAGADRLVNALAARELFGAPVIVVDFGTATTFDVVGADGAYLGGAISPGIRLSLKTLHEETAKLPLIELEQPRDGVIGKSTAQAMQSGIFYGYLGLIEGVVSRLRAELGGRAATVATGGYAPLFTKNTGALDHARTDLTLQGLRLVYERNKARG